ncbi:unnamed protein product [Nippostrongylus brasiliensis]|uniref:ADAM_CR_2 domain-containing protein n=1 Tax=Nippostrongylus brasiliensis TaxID=27835 RepID=A0A158R1H9_NIPBR|nr:unnamed protein product [Nippostrongylus brasiliensis]
MLSLELIVLSYATIVQAVDGAWGKWSAWSECSEGCGFSIQSRNRACDNPAPSLGGQPCYGLAHQTSVCDAESCNGAVPLTALEHSETCFTRNILEH